MLSQTPRNAGHYPRVSTRNPIMLNVTQGARRSCVHELSYIPHAHSLIPSTACRPTLTAEQAPINTCCKFRVLSHSTKLSGYRLLLAVAPHPTCHVVAGAQKQIRKMRTPCYLAHGVAMTLQQLKWTFRLSNIECANDSVDSACRNDCTSVFVPVVCKSFSGREGGLWSTNTASDWCSMNRYL